MLEEAAVAQYISFFALAGSAQQDDTTRQGQAVAKNIDSKIYGNREFEC